MNSKRLLMACCLAGLFLFGCAELQIDPVDENGLTNAEIVGSSSVSLMAIPADAEVIDFESYATGAILSEVHSNSGVGPIGLVGFNPNRGPLLNAAMIFDSSMPTGGDPDLGTPNEDFGGPGIGVGGEAGSTYENTTALGKVLIISEDLRSANPDDADVVGSYYSFDFSALTNITVYSMNILDIESEENPATVTFYDAAGSVIGSPFTIPDVGDNGSYNQVFGEGVAGVDSMVVALNGSGAIDNIVFQSVIPPPPGSGCTRTQGYWKNHTQYSSARRDATWDEIGALAENTPFFLSGQTYLQVLQTEAKGNAYYILAVQYIAAQLNTLAEAGTTTEVDDAMDQAEILFNTYTPAQIASLPGSSTLRQSFVAYGLTLDNYNNGHLTQCNNEEEAE